jgi:hypothetical protein
MPSNLANTVMQDLYKEESTFDKNEFRDPTTGALAAAIKQNSDAGALLDDDMRSKLDASFERDVQIPVINWQDPTIGTAETCAFQTEGLNSSLITVSKVPVTFGFAMAPTQHAENYVSYRKTFDTLLGMREQKVLKQLDTAVVAMLEANKNQYWGGLSNPYAVSGNSLLVSQEGKEDLYNQLLSLGMQMDFSQLSDIVASASHGADVRRLAAQGAGNSVNQDFQFGGLNWFWSNQITNRTGIDLDGAGAGTATGNAASTVYAIAPGSIGIHTSINHAYRGAGFSAGDGSEWSSVRLPKLGITAGLLYKSKCDDISAYQASGLSRQIAVPVESFLFSFNYYLVKVHNSAPATRYNPIVKFEILNA